MVPRTPGPATRVKLNLPQPLLPGLPLTAWAGSKRSYRPSDVGPDLAGHTYRVDSFVTVTQQCSLPQKGHQYTRHSGGAMMPRRRYEVWQGGFSPLGFGGCYPWLGHHRN